MVDWQPIETAPKDGNIMVAYATGFGGAFGILPVVSVAFWYDIGDTPGWNDLLYNTSSTPTHWMPLPEPPNA